MRKLLAVMTVLAAVGCGSRANTLTPLEEYAIALQVFDREMQQLKSFRETHDPSIPRDKEILDGAQENFDLATGLLHKARARLQDEARKSAKDGR